MSDVLVTGATGFVGRALCAALEGQGDAVVQLSSRDGDIADPATLAGLRRVEHVCHLASRTFVPASWENPLEFHRVNVLGTANVLEYCRRHGASLTFVSAYVYGVQEKQPISEACTPRPNNPYALTKYLAEQICEFYSVHRGVDIVVIRPFNIFGPGQSANFLIPKIIEQVRTGSAITVHDLAPRRDYVYLDDLVAALLMSIRRAGSTASQHRVFNVGSGRSLSVGEVVAAIQDAAGTVIPVRSENAVRVNEMSDVCADISLAEAELGWKPRTEFHDGIVRTWHASTR